MSQPRFDIFFDRLAEAHREPALHDDQKRTGRLLLLGKGAVPAHRLARPLAAESDDDEQSGRRARRNRDP